ncbi:copper resistance CopC family protein [Sulfitobacter sp. HGT1]|uniref:copper resistance CopC family protein n=1 Tax=Sulfitobacter sp. HGT1 TaxID=2735435 RepID=UPI00159389C0|nr:copper resistance CopC family protein [Sulfitobacter sp. HGT1]
MRRPITLAAVFLFALTFAAGQTAAHSKKQATVPADGAVLAISPETIAMTFDMPLRVTLISLRDQDGTDHALTRSDNMQPVSDFAATPPALSAGTYTVEWRGLAADGHPMQGQFSFDIAE